MSSVYSIFFFVIRKRDEIARSVRFVQIILKLRTSRNRMSFVYFIVLAFEFCMVVIVVAVFFALNNRLQLVYGRSLVQRKNITKSSSSY